MLNMDTSTGLTRGSFPAPALRLRQGLLVPGHKIGWENCGRKHGGIRYRLSAYFRGTDPALRGVGRNHFFRHFVDDPEDFEDLWRQVTGQMPGLPDLPRPSWIPALEDYPGLIYAADTITFLTTTGSGSYSRPADWDDANNHIEGIGGGGRYSDGAGYARVNNQTLSSSTSYNVAAGLSTSTSPSLLAGENTTFSSLTAAGGSSATPNAGDVTHGGGTAGADGSVANWGAPGGPGGPTTAGSNGGSGTASDYPSAGGGAANSTHNGSNATSTDGGNGGANRNNTGAGTGGSSGSHPGTAGTDGAGGGGGYGAAGVSTSGVGGDGGPGTEWDGSHGAGGSGGSAGGQTSGTQGAGGNGALYGGSAGHGAFNVTGGTSGNSGTAAQGLLVTTYTPLTGGLFKQTSMDGLGSGGPFFGDPLTRMKGRDQ